MISICFFVSFVSLVHGAVFSDLLPGLSQNNRNEAVIVMGSDTEKVSLVNRAPSSRRESFKPPRRLRNKRRKKFPKTLPKKHFSANDIYDSYFEPEYEYEEFYPSRLLDYDDTYYGEREETHYHLNEEQIKGFLPDYLLKGPAVEYSKNGSNGFDIPRFPSLASVFKKSKRKRVKRSHFPSKSRFVHNYHMDPVGYKPPHYMEGMDFTLEAVFGLPMSDYYKTNYHAYSPMDHLSKASSYYKPVYRSEKTPVYKVSAPMFHKKPEYHKPMLHLEPEYNSEPYTATKHKYEPDYDHEPDYMNPEYSSKPKYNLEPEYKKPKFNTPKFAKQGRNKNIGPENGYAVYYLPYDQYVLEYPHLGLTPRIPTLPGNAHVVFPSPHRPPLGTRKRRSVQDAGQYSSSLISLEEDLKTSNSHIRNKKSFPPCSAQLDQGEWSPCRVQGNKRRRTIVRSTFPVIPPRLGQPGSLSNPLPVDVSIIPQPSVITRNTRSQGPVKSLILTTNQGVSVQNPAVKALSPQINFSASGAKFIPPQALSQRPPIDGSFFPKGTTILDILAIRATTPVPKSVQQQSVFVQRQGKSPSSDKSLDFPGLTDLLDKLEEDKNVDDEAFIKAFQNSPSYLQIQKLKNVSLVIQDVVLETEKLVKRRGNLSLLDFKLLRSLKRKEKKIDEMISLLKARKSRNLGLATPEIVEALNDSEFDHPSGNPWNLKSANEFLNNAKLGDSNDFERSIKSLPFDQKSFENEVVDGTATLQETNETEEILKARKEALARASEKQELLISNLGDAIQRRKNGGPNPNLDAVESALKQQALLLNRFKSSLNAIDEISDIPNNEDRLNYLEDASHRQLEVLEALVEAVSRFESQKTVKELKKDTKEDQKSAAFSRLRVGTPLGASPSPRALAWYRRFTDKYRIRQLQKKTKNFNGKSRS